MWVTCAICGKQYVDDEYITDTRTYNICPLCYKKGYRIELKTSKTTSTSSPNNIELLEEK